MVFMGGGPVQALNNPPGDKVQDLVRVPDLVHVQPGPGVQCLKVGRPLQGFEVPPLHGPGGWGHPVDRHGRDHGGVVRGGVTEHGHCGLQVLGHADVVEDQLVPPHFSAHPPVLAVRAVRDPHLQVPHVGLCYGVVVCEHEASPAVPHVAPPGRVEVDITYEDDVIHLCGYCLQLVPDPGQGRGLPGQVGTTPCICRRSESK
jgi:hypothetical protein